MRDAIEFSPEARAELDDVIDYIAERNLAAALQAQSAIESVLDMLTTHEPRTDGPAVTLRKEGPCREWFVHPVTLYYQRVRGVLWIMHVHHHAREPIAR